MCWRVEQDDRGVSDVECAGGCAGGWRAQPHDLCSAEHKNSSIHSTQGYTRKDRLTPLTHASQSDGSLARVRQEEGAPKLVMQLRDAVADAAMLRRG
jgi:hypothetical protein